MKVQNLKPFSLSVFFLHWHVKGFSSQRTAVKVDVVFVCFVVSDALTTTCHLAIVNVCVIIILSIGNTQISILLLCFLYLFVELMITMNE